MRTISLDRNEAEWLVDLLENCDRTTSGSWRFDLADQVRESFGMVKRDDPEITIILTKQLINACRTDRGAFTNATLRGFGITKEDMTTGWPSRLIGKRIPNQQYQKALDGRTFYNSGKLE